MLTLLFQCAGIAIESLKLSDIEYSFIVSSIKNNLENSCWKLWHSCVITWDGKVLPCCFDKDAQHQLGDLTTHTFAQIWENEAYKKFRSQLVKGRKEIDI